MRTEPEGGQPLPPAPPRLSPGGEGAAPGFLRVERRRYEAALLTREEGNALLHRIAVEEIRAGLGGALLSLEGEVVRDLSARATAERILAFAVRAWRARGVAPSRAGLESRFLRIQEAVERGIRRTARLLEALGAGEDVLAEVGQAGARVREGLARRRGPA